MNNSKLDTFFRPVAARLHANHMSRLGIANTMRLAYFYNRLKFGRQDDWRRALYRTQLATLLEENGGLSRPSIDMKDGWALDTSMSLPEPLPSRAAAGHNPRAWPLDVFPARYFAKGPLGPELLEPTTRLSRKRRGYLFCRRAKGSYRILLPAWRRSFY